MKQMKGKGIAKTSRWFTDENRCGKKRLKENVKIGIIYGHPNTGRLELEFCSRGVSVNSNEFTKQWNQYLGWVKYN